MLFTIIVTKLLLIYYFLFLFFSGLQSNDTKNLQEAREAIKNPRSYPRSAVALTET